MSASKHADLIIVGGGLSGSLAAWLVARHTDLNVLLVERGDRLGGNHTWSFFGTDVTAAGLEALKPLICHSWQGYSVRFPKYNRDLETPYHSISSERFAARISEDLGPGSICFGNAIEVTSDRVTIAGGDVLAAPCVIDARGNGDNRHLVLGFQKFLGLELRLREPHGLARPIIMDATVSQSDGYRFVYSLPFSADTLLIEDTYYSDDMNMSGDALSHRIEDYASQMGWKPDTVLRQEQGVLPILLAGDIEQHINSGNDGLARIGLGAALFHPTTGYSLPDAIETALLLKDYFVAHAQPRTSDLCALMAEHVRTTWRDRSYFRLLNRMMFKAGQPDQRYQILQRFYRFDAGLIQRFYSARLTMADRLRIVTGRPPVPIRSALSYVSERRMLQNELKDA